MNERMGSNNILLQNKKLQLSDYMNAYLTSNQTSNQTLGNSICNVTVPTPAEAAMMAEIKRLREQNNAHLTRLARDGFLSLMSLAMNGNNIDAIPQNEAHRVNGQMIADYISSRENSNSTAPPSLANIAAACFNRYSGSLSSNLNPSDKKGVSPASRFSHSP